MAVESSRRFDVHNVATFLADDDLYEVEIGIVDKREDEFEAVDNYTDAAGGAALIPDDLLSP